MIPFAFLQPTSVDDALAAWTPGAAWLGGGTNLVDLMKTGGGQPSLLIDLSRLPGLRDIEMSDDGGARVGALVSNADLADHPAFAARFPMVAEALLAGASGQIRNAATVAGNILQYPRDAFFKHLGEDPLDGDTTSLSILGANGPVAVHPSDFCVPLAALDAVVEVQGPNGPRDIALADLLAPTADTRTALAPGELVLALRLPAEGATFAGHARYLKVRDRTSFAFALTSAAAALRFDGPRIAEARLALGAVAPTPWRVAEAEALMAGQAPDADLFERAAQTALSGAVAIGDTGWKIELARRTAIRALTLAAAHTPARLPALPGSPFAAQAKDHAHA
ncbi:MAG: molybdopterin dehydrogenase [Rhodobacteraceae bacterium]|nr:molybdopterin dehydrogenase [Paracoccaceae bacterium]